LALEHLVSEAHREGAVADRFRDPLGGFRAYVAGDKDARRDGRSVQWRSLTAYAP
jgi:hypothetical protein